MWDALLSEDFCRMTLIPVDSQKKLDKQIDN
jgi:hypothetical protein